MENTDELRERAERYRYIASRTDDTRAVAALLELAQEYDILAAELAASAQFWPNKD